MNADVLFLKVDCLARSVNTALLAGR